MTEIQITPLMADEEPIRRLYETAFPAEEKIPYEVLKRLMKEMSLDFTAYYEGEEFLGFTIVYPRQSFNWFWYFAVRDELRGKGVGQQILSRLLLRYKDCTNILDMESPFQECDNQEVRRRRYAFYQRNGFRDTGIGKSFDGVDMTILMNGQGTFTMQDYETVLDELRACWDAMPKDENLKGGAMKLLWIDLNCSYAHSSLALPALHAQVMHRTDVEWQVVRTTNNEVLGTTVDAICAHRPDVVVATAWLFTHEQLLHLVARVKALLPAVKVILGGPEFLGDNEAYLHRHPEVDAVLRGEGEESFARWLDVWDEPEKWAEIPGLCYLDTPSKKYHDGGLARVMDFDRLLPPEESSLFTWDKPFVQVETTRGCFNSCAFCVSGVGDPIRTLPLDVIRQRLCRIRDRGIRDVRILDRTFNYHPRQAVELLRLFAEFHPRLRFHLEIHPALLPQPVRQVLAELPVGLLHLEAGIQSLRQEVLDMSRRKGTLEQALDGLRFLCSLPNLVTHADLIAGLPLYTLPQIYEDIRTLAAYHAGEIQLESLKLLPGTVMRRDAEELGIRYSPLPPYEVLATHHISSAQLQEARRLSRLLDAYYNTDAWQSLTRRLILDDEEFLHRFLHYLTMHNYIDQPMSLEHRGELLYRFCSECYPRYQVEASVAWIEAGMSLRKQPAERVKRGRLQPPTDWQIEYGVYDETLRLCFLPADDDNWGYWFGYDSTSQCPAPIFKAVGKFLVQTDK